MNLSKYRKQKDETIKSFNLILKVGDKIECPDGSINTIVGFDTDLNLFYTFIQGAKCFIDGEDFILTN